MFKSAITKKRPICFLLGGQVISLICYVIMIWHYVCMSSHAAYLTATFVMDLGQVEPFKPIHGIPIPYFSERTKNKQLSLGSPGTMGPVY